MIKNPLAPLGSLLLATLIAGASASALRADDDDARDHELARQALKEGRIKPLTEITTLLQQQMPGEIVGVDLDRNDKTGAFFYEFKLLTKDGHLKEADVDAATGAILKVEEDDD